MHTKSYSIFALLAFATAVASEGLNCMGSGFCGLVSLGTNAPAELNGNIQANVQDDTFYNNGQLITCVQVPAAFEAGFIPICAFLQITGGEFGSLIKEISQILADHDCGACGSVPTGFPDGDNNVNDGILTFNVVSNPDCPMSDSSSLCGE